MKKIISAVLACTLAVGLTACTFKTPETVGSIGSTTFSAGTYLMKQLSAVSSAMELADGADTVKDMLAAQLTLEDGTTQKGSDFVAADTLENMQYEAAVESEFAACGLELDADTAAQIKAQAAQMWSVYSETYKQNGIGQAAVERSVEMSVKAGMVFDEKYKDLPDAECRSWLKENAAAGYVLELPLINTQSFSFADEETTEKINALAEDAAADLRGGKTVEEIADDYLGETYDLLGMEYTEEMQSAGSALFLPSTFASYGDEYRETVMGLKNGEVTVMNMGTSILVFMKDDAENVYSMEEIRSGYGIVTEMKSEEFNEAMTAEGAAMPHALDAKAMGIYKASNVVL